jgi:hypothetical protein
MRLSPLIAQWALESGENLSPVFGNNCCSCPGARKTEMSRVLNFCSLTLMIGVPHGPYDERLDWRSVSEGEMAEKSARGGSPRLRYDVNHDENMALNPDCQRAFGRVLRCTVLYDLCVVHSGQCRGKPGFLIAECSVKADNLVGGSCRELTGTAERFGLVVASGASLDQIQSSDSQNAT